MISVSLSSPSEPFLSPVLSDHDYLENKKECLGCKDKDNLLQSLNKKINLLSLENKVLKRKLVFNTAKAICNDSGFFDLLERGDEIMADSGFQIREELMLRYCTLSVPPGARVKAQMTASECKHTKDVAKLRIHVEHAINRIKRYRISKNVLPIKMPHHC